MGSDAPRRTAWLPIYRTGTTGTKGNGHRQRRSAPHWLARISHSEGRLSLELVVG